MVLTVAGLSCEGIIRIPGNRASMEHIMNSVDQDAQVNWDDEDPFDVAGVIKV